MPVIIVSTPTRFQRAERQARDLGWDATRATSPGAQLAAEQSAADAYRKALDTYQARAWDVADDAVASAVNLVKAGQPDVLAYEAAAAEAYRRLGAREDVRQDAEGVALEAEKAAAKLRAAGARDVGPLTDVATAIRTRAAALHARPALVWWDPRTWRAFN